MSAPPKTPRQRSDRNAKEVAELFARALQHYQRGDRRAAGEQLQAVLARQPDHVGSLHQLGIIALQNGQPDLAIELIGRAIALNEQVPDFHYNIGIAYGSIGKFDQAIAHNRKAIELKPDHGPEFVILGQALRAQGGTDEAVDSGVTGQAGVQQDSRKKFFEVCIS